jgi:hypothetical protein
MSSYTSLRNSLTTPFFKGSFAPESNIDVEAERNPLNVSSRSPKPGSLDSIFYTNRRNNVDDGNYSNHAERESDPRFFLQSDELSGFSGSKLNRRRAGSSFSKGSEKNNSRYDSSSGDESEAGLQSVAINNSRHSVLHFNNSLMDLNPYLDRRIIDKQQIVEMLEIDSSTGKGTCKAMNLRQLLAYVNGIVNKIDQTHALNKAQKPPGDSSSGVNAGSTGSDTNNSADDSNVSPVGYLQYRDIRRLEYSFNPHEEPAVLIRRHAVIFSFTPLRAIVMADRLIFIVPNGADSLLKTLENHMKDWAHWAPEDSAKVPPLIPGVKSKSPEPPPFARTLSKTSASSRSAFGLGDEILSGDAHAGSLAGANGGKSTISSVLFQQVSNPPGEPFEHVDSIDVDYESSLPFECQSYEALLSTVIALQTKELNVLSDEVSKVLFHFRNHSIMSVEVQENIRVLKNRLSSLSSKIISYKRALADLIDDATHPVLMSLTALMQNPEIYRYSARCAIYMCC